MVHTGGQLGLFSDMIIQRWGKKTRLPFILNSTIHEF